MASHMYISHCRKVDAAGRPLHGVFRLYLLLMGRRAASSKVLVEVSRPLHCVHGWLLYVSVCNPEQQLDKLCRAAATGASFSALSRRGGRRQPATTAVPTREAMMLPLSALIDLVTFQNTHKTGIEGAAHRRWGSSSSLRALD